MNRSESPFVSFDVQQLKEGTRLRISLVVGPEFELTNLTATYRDYKFGLAAFELQGTTGENDQKRCYSAEFDLLEFASTVHSEAPELFEAFEARVPGEDKKRFKLYAGTPWKSPESKEDANPGISTADEFIEYAIGRAEENSIGRFITLDTEFGKLTPYLNQGRWLSIALDDPPQPRIRVFNDGLTIKDGCLSVRGFIDTGHVEVLSARLMILGRTTGYSASAVSKIDLNAQLTNERFGHRSYAFESTYDFKQDIDLINDDVTDLYIELDTPQYEEPVRKRIGVSRYLVRRQARADVIRRGNEAVAIVPYYTFKAKYPSLQFEVFKTEEYKYLQRVIKRGIDKKPSDGRPVWVVGEVRYKAQDNGMWLFKYLRDKHPEINAYYVIDRDSPDRRNLLGYESNVLDFRSKEHIDALLVAERIIGTHQPVQLYPTRDKRFRRRLRGKHVFLQHGITAAKWIAPVNGRYASDFQTDLVIVASEREKEFFVYDCGYSEAHVAVTGFARFDNLFADDISVKEKQLLIMPTWRPWLQNSDAFKDSEYFQRWMGLITGGRLAALKEQYGIDVVLCLHPNMQQFSELFTSLGLRVVLQGEVDVQYLLKESAVMLTDYSSVAFDFAFMNKPVVFYQFDPNEFDTPHADPFTELPGPVVPDEPSVLNHLFHIFSNSAEIEPNYAKRADRFLKVRDTNNRERIVSAILQLASRPSTATDFKNAEVVSTASKQLKKKPFYKKLVELSYSVFRMLPMRSDIIVFESDLARGFRDNPKAIYDELISQGDTRRKVIVSNRRVRVYDPETIVVKRHSLGFAWYLARAKYWINNQNFPEYIVRRRRGVYVQTWHGTPLKRMFLDQENFFGRDPGYVDRVKKMTAQWNTLVSPSEFTTNALRSSYSYTGPAFELGYPRNDVLAQPEKGALGAAVRSGLGIAPEKFVVLYAPTFRDNKPTTRGRFAFDWPFDPREFVAELGDEVVLLVRTHNLVSTKVVVPDEIAKNVIDVSAFPEMNHLFLASDMLVTDYSSSFFDFSVLQRPIAFYAFDLDDYRDSVRGFYLDYETELPGPIVQSKRALYDEIKRQSNTSTRMRQPIDPEFLRRFAPHEDGQASARVIKELLS